jgi:hypothetical protein
MRSHFILKSVLFCFLFLIFQPRLVVADCSNEILSDQQLIRIHESKIFEKSRELRKSFVFKNSEGFETWSIQGLPSGVKKIGTKDRVFRHYSYAFQIIQSDQHLQTGVTPYVVIHPGVRREIYEDLTGIFLTDPHIEPRRVGLSDDLKNKFVDFKIPDGYSVYELEPGIYLIPTPPLVPGWLRDSYQAYRLNSVLPKDQSIRAAIFSLSARGALTRPVRVPILIQK